MCSISEYLLTYEGFFWVLFLVCVIQYIYIRGISTRMLVMQNVFHELKKELQAAHGEYDD